MSGAASHLPVKLLKEDLHNHTSMSLPSCVFIVKTNPLSSTQKAVFKTDKSGNRGFLDLNGRDACLVRATLLESPGYPCSVQKGLSAARC